ncbi:TPA: hypothetical protein ACOFC9_001014 [Stenotrophomonas maltophilia]|uniref:hypothetical protein n=1 Tax=Stenotrophomonas maltophilia TaxID=40324 RepID=UPI002806515D|nr:hypothetical protein [Stenotrophomonas maltophilia]WME83240.1 hypothetical protein RBI20_02480 [Stenotrophomonas maltophilia]
MAKPRTAPPSALKTAQDSKPAAAPAVTEEKPAEPTKTPLDRPADGDVDATASSGLGTGPALEPTANDQASGAGGDVTPSAPPATADANGAAGAADDPATGVNSHDDDAPARVCFEVLTPFKFKGNPVKPPAWIEISEADAAIYQDAGVLGREPAEPFDHV